MSEYKWKAVKMWGGWAAMSSLPAGGQNMFVATFPTEEHAKSFVEAQLENKELIDTRGA